MRSAQEGDLAAITARRGPRTEQSAPSATTASCAAGRGPRVPRGRAQHLEPDAAFRRPVGHQAGGSVGLVLDDERPRQPRYPLTLKAPRMNGWMRQKYVYVPSARDSSGVCHVLRPEAGTPNVAARAELGRVERHRAVGQRVGDAAEPPCTASAHDVTVWKMYRGASRLRNVSAWPRWTTAGRPAAPRDVRSPWL